MSIGLLNFKTPTNFVLIFIICFSFTFQLPHKEGKNLLSRLLSGSDSTQKTSKICQKTSSEFSKYYKKGDRSILNMDEDETEKYDSYYVKALINIVRHYYDTKREDQNKNLRLLGSDGDSSDYKKYVYDYAYHVLPYLVVIGIGILSIAAWIVWIVCVCKKCKCCICKGPKFKTPSIVLALIFYIIASLVSIYSLVQENKFFTSLADLEC